jgi:hypothetical protein
VIRLRLEMYPKAAAWIERPFTLRSKRSGIGSRFDFIRLDDGSRALFTSHRREHYLVNKYIGSSKASRSARVYRRANGSCIFSSTAEPVTWSTRA